LAELCQIVSEGRLNGNRVVVKQPKVGNLDTQLKVGRCVIRFIGIYHSDWLNFINKFSPAFENQELRELSRLPPHPHVLPIIGVCLEETYVAAVLPFVSGGFVCVCWIDCVCVGTVNFNLFMFSDLCKRRLNRI
jgi:hypothetical protein